MTPSGLLMSHTIRGSNPPRLDVSYPVETESSVLSVMCSGGSNPPNTIRGSNPPRLDVSYPVETESSVLSVMCSGGSNPPNTIRGSNPPRLDVSYPVETESSVLSVMNLGGDYGPNPGLTTQGSCREEAYSLISATPDELIPQWSVSCCKTRQKQFTFDLENKHNFKFCLIHLFVKDLTNDGDIESNPGPVSFNSHEFEDITLLSECEWLELFHLLFP
ncbi:hypothetical protein GEMRC1_011790 [Eukaryota sp. GEM-RC1]